jgi:hypothetical protein
VVWIWISRRPKLGDRRLFGFFGAAAVVLCILTLQDALWFWQHAPLLHNVQLPWRLLGPVAICMALVIAQLGQLLSRAPRWRTLGIAGAMALLIVPNLSHLHSKQLVDVDRALDARATVDPWLRPQPWRSRAALDGGPAPVHSGCSDGAFGTRRYDVQDARRLRSSP